MLSFLRQATASGGRAQEYWLKYCKIPTEEQVPRGADRTLGQITLANRFLLQCQLGVFKEMGRTDARNVQSRERARLCSHPTGTSKNRVAGVLWGVPWEFEPQQGHPCQRKCLFIQFNETQRERVVTEHLVEEVALLQEKRLGIQEQSKNLKHHQETLLEENTRIQMENRELKSFFVGNQGEEERLASKMKARIEELRDSLAEA